MKMPANITVDVLLESIMCLAGKIEPFLPCSRIAVGATNFVDEGEGQVRAFAFTSCKAPINAQHWSLTLRCGCSPFGLLWLL